MTNKTAERDELVSAAQAMDRARMTTRAIRQWHQARRDSMERYQASRAA